MSKRTHTNLAVLPHPEADPWPMLWQSFERGLRAGSGTRNGKPAAVRTLEIYGDGGRIFHDWSAERNLPTDPTAITKSQVEDFLVWLRAERGAKEATVRARFSALRRFLSWCVEEGEIEHSPMARMHGPKVDEPPPAVLSEEDQRRLLAACKGDEFEDRRDAALLRLMLDAGIRRGEAASIQLVDLDLNGMVVKILGKGNRPGQAYFGAKTARDLDRYLRVRARHPRAALPELWLAQKGALSGDGIHHLIGRRARMAGIERAVHPHLTRHSWADAMKRGGASDEDVMTLGHWRDSKIMRRYAASAAQSRAQETHRRLSPGDRL